jgi:hypothetical protein
MEKVGRERRKRWGKKKRKGRAIRKTRVDGSIGKIRKFSEGWEKFGEYKGKSGGLARKRLEESGGKDGQSEREKLRESEGKDG